MPTVIIRFVQFHKKALIMKNGHKLISSDEKEFVRVDYLNDLDKLKKPIKKQARQNINIKQEWKWTHDRMEEARLRVESYEKRLR